MNLSNALCRAQEVLHLRRAAETSLENVRRVATDAAAAWAKEALAAAKREDRQTVTAAAAKARADASPGWTTDDEMLASENPDRGRASIALLT